MAGGSIARRIGFILAAVLVGTGLLWYATYTGAEEGPFLHYLLERRHASLVRALLGMGWDPTDTNRAGETILHRAILANDLATARASEAAGADVNRRDAGFESCLSLACQKSDATMVGFLIEAGADVNLPLRKRKRSLHSAARQGDHAMVDLLLEAGADKGAAFLRGDVADTGGLAWYVALHAGDLSLARKLYHWQGPSLVPGPEDKYRDGLILLAAIQRRRRDVVQSILEEGFRLTALYVPKRGF